MALWSGYIGLTIAFVLLAAVLLWVVIAARGNIMVKMVLIPMTIWYGAALYFSVQNLMGWPTARSMPENSYILAYRIREPEPRNDYPGAIFLWVSTRSPEYAENQSSFALIPKNVFMYRDSADPRAFRLPYSRQMHRELRQAREQMQGRPGSMLQAKKDKGGQQGQGGNKESSRSPLQFEIINPIQMLPKKDDASYSFY